MIMLSTPKSKLSVKKPNGPPKRQDEITAHFFLLCHQEKKPWFFITLPTQKAFISAHTLIILKTRIFFRKIYSMKGIFRSIQSDILRRENTRVSQIRIILNEGNKRVVFPTSPYDGANNYFQLKNSDCTAD